MKRQMRAPTKTGQNSDMYRHVSSPISSKTVFFSLFADRRLDAWEWTGEFLKLRDRIEAGVANARGRPGAR